MRTALVCGGGIAGPNVAHWLARHGWAVTVVERARAPRRGGQAVDVRGAALTVVTEMGLRERLETARTRMRGMAVLDGDGNELMRTTEGTWSGGRFDDPDVEVLREDLTDLLMERTDAAVTFRFGTAVTGLSGTEVSFSDGTSAPFDLVVGADGLRSSVRRLAFGPDRDHVRPMDAFVGVYGMPNVLRLDNWQLWVQDGGVGLAVYPVRDNTELRVTAGVPCAANAPTGTDAQKRLIADGMAHLKWEVPTLLAGMWDAADFYADVMAQVHMERWSAGNVVLVGDAGYCASPLSGQGTSLALVGGYVLAQELQKGIAAGLAAYEERMRPFVAANQAVATGDPDLCEAALEEAKNAISL